MPRLDEKTLNTIALRMLSDFDAANLGTIFAQGLRFGITVAWRVRTTVTALREELGETIVESKIGCVCKGNHK